MITIFLILYHDIVYHISYYNIMLISYAAYSSSCHNNLNIILVLLCYNVIYIILYHYIIILYPAYSKYITHSRISKKGTKNCNFLIFWNILNYSHSIKNISRVRYMLYNPKAANIILWRLSTNKKVAKNCNFWIF